MKTHLGIPPHYDAMPCGPTPKGWYATTYQVKHVTCTNCKRTKAYKEAQKRSKK